MAFKMKGIKDFGEGTPLYNKGKKTIAGENTDVLKRDSKGKSYTQAMDATASGVTPSDTIFVPDYKIPTTYGYVEGGANYDLEETADSKKRGKGKPKSYTMKNQPAPTKKKYYK
jgi:hypothetical protein